MYFADVYMPGKASNVSFESYVRCIEKQSKVHDCIRLNKILAVSEEENLAVSED